MICTEEMYCGSTLCIKTYSDEHRYVVRDGVNYEEAIDPAFAHRTYTEGDYIEECD